jgi:ribosomal protein S18 acetylase RimI-like enzyme
MVEFIVLLKGKDVKKLELNIIKHSLKLIKIIGMKKYLITLLRSFLASSFPKISNDELFIQAITVDKKYRGQYVGSELLNFAFSEAEKQNYSKVSLYVEIDNERAVNVYKKNGFEIVLTVKFSKVLSKNNILGMHKMVKEI